MTEAPQKPGRSRRQSRPNGQWLVDGREPLNHNEEFKQADDALNVLHRLKQYADEGFEAIPADDLRGRMRWMGLYTQRKPGIDGGRTASIAPEELDDSYFMLRVRVDGGALSTDQLRVLGEISTRFARGTADITDRENIQYHWIRIEDVPEIFARLDAVGLRTTEACGDCPRVILGSPVAGVAKDEIIDPTPAIAAIQEAGIGNPEYSNLPRKFKTALTGHPSHDVVHEINDVSFVGVVHPELGAGYDLWVGGGLSTSAHLAVRLGTFVRPDEVAEVWQGVVSIFRDYGYRRLRNRARMKYLVQDWGAEKVRQVLQDEYLHRELPDGPAPERPVGPGDHIGVHEQKDGRFYVGLAPTVGRVSGDILTEVAQAAEAAGSQRVRLTPYQKLLVLDVPGEAVETLCERLEKVGLTARPSMFRRHTMACTGIEFCKLAIVETKASAAAAVDELEKRFAGESIEVPISLHLNGCPNSCARIQTADIGLKGQLVTDDNGEQVPGFQVHLGGGLDNRTRDESGFGRTVRGLKVTIDDLPDYVERIVRRFLAERDSQESFASWAMRAEEDALV